MVPVGNGDIVGVEDAVGYGEIVGFQDAVGNGDIVGVEEAVGYGDIDRKSYDGDAAGEIVGRDPLP